MIPSFILHLKGVVFRAGLSVNLIFLAAIAAIAAFQMTRGPEGVDESRASMVDLSARIPNRILQDLNIHFNHIWTC